MSDLRRILDMFEQSPIVAATKSDELLREAARAESSVVFILNGSIMRLAEQVETVKQAGKTAIVHVDLVSGLAGKDPVAVDFVREATRADGIISTKVQMVRRAKELGMIAGMRTFMIDSLALEGVKTQLASVKPDFLEVMPGLLTDIITELHREFPIPLVAGGLIRTKKDILTALQGGACAISTTKKELWSM